MNRYKDYHVEDFVLDRSFQQWVRYRTAEQSGLWESYRVDHPAQAKDIETARVLLMGIYTQSDELISDTEIDEEIAGLIQRIRAEKVEAVVFETELEHETVALPSSYIFGGLVQQQRC
jgi:transmembrane sensor